MMQVNGGARPTQRTIAERAGVSVAAVSRALADDPKIAEHTRAQIKEIAAQIGYIPDRAAQRLRTGRTQVINLILPPHEEIFGFGTSLISGISRALSATSYHLVVTPDFGLEEQGNVIERVVQNRLADGIIFSRTAPHDRRVRYLLEADFPFICHGRTELATPHPYVDFDNFEFARQATEQLVGSGAERLAIVLPPENLTFRQHLLHGFMTAVRAVGVAHEIVDSVSLDSDAAALKSAMQDRFHAGSPPDGLVCPGEMAGLAALAAVQDTGLVPGRDVKLVIKQASGVFDLVRPKVGSLYEDLEGAGFELATRLLRRIAGEPVESLQHVQRVLGAPGR
ncbi:LacI family transcriptional regulator [Qingshengfaniella alkalisoli]|uniref:LacI family DNA-binding transcriptional regulator n=1 Tax=Qingshengfaniella alkalisoli TaxID=2599296 RepID=A0A5B8IA71_9RHOB|nr:LacI family transcriptional regulator [Qingshengfaniella alkalisoli]QDY71325.1 LacI family DNA-binding transcriptional regulator [Qingshengfaniella alkalisoli]